MSRQRGGTQAEQQGLAALIAEIGRPRFCEALLNMAGSGVSHEASALMVLHPAAPPAVLVDRLKPAERGYLYGDYLSGVYALSPFYRLSHRLKGPRAARVLDVAPKGFRDSEYYRRYFALIGVEDMMGLLIPSSDNEVVFISFSRGAGQARFSLAEQRGLEAKAPVLAAAVLRHTDLSGPMASRHIAAAAAPPLHRRDGSGLTAREAQVVNLILQGHSARAIGEVLKISGETVRVHRRHIYEKLGVASQAELFRWFLSSRA